MTEDTSKPPSRREHARQQTYAEIVRAARELMAERSEPTLRAVAARMGLTAPALYRYVDDYQQLVDLLAFEIDQSVARDLRRVAARHPDDPALQLVEIAVEFRRWAMANPTEFAMVFANPIIESTCADRWLDSTDTTGHVMTGLLTDLWRTYHFPIPRVADLDPVLRAWVKDPILPMDVSTLAPADRGLVVVVTQAWTAFYGATALEVYGHSDPRLIQSAGLFRLFTDEWLVRLGLADERARMVRLRNRLLR